MYMWFWKDFLIRKKLHWMMIKPGDDLSNKMFFRILDFIPQCWVSHTIHGNVVSMPRRWGWDSEEQICLNGWKQFSLAVAFPNLPSTISEVNLPSWPAGVGMLWCSHPCLGCCWVLLKPLCCLSQRTQGMFLALLHRAGSAVGIQRKENPGKNYGCEGIFWYPLKGNISRGIFPLWNEVNIQKWFVCALKFKCRISLSMLFKGPFLPRVIWLQTFLKEENLCKAPITWSLLCSALTGQITLSQEPFFHSLGYHCGPGSGTHLIVEFWVFLCHAMEKKVLLDKALAFVVHHKCSVLLLKSQN